MAMYNRVALNRPLFAKGFAMRWLRNVTFLFVLTSLLSACISANACPLCKDAISSPGDSDDEIITAPAAYNHSIYLMAGMPYVLLSYFGIMIYRGCKKNDEYLRGLGEPETGGFHARS
jgi:hypothetical protein